jgi:hypothetical protein
VAQVVVLETILQEVEAVAALVDLELQQVLQFLQDLQLQ